MLKPLPNLRDDQLAGFGSGHPGIVDHGSAERNPERSAGALAVTLITRGQIFPDAFGFAARGTFFDASVQVKFKVSFRKNIRADVASLHHEASKFDTLALFLFHPFADVRNSGDVRDYGTGFSRPNLLLGIIPCHQQVNMPMNAFE